MKRLRILIPLGLTLALLALAISWALKPAGHLTPAACLEAYREAMVTGDLTAYLNCLAEPLRIDTQQRYPDRRPLSEALRAEMKDLKGWTQSEAATEGTTVRIDVDEVRTEGIRRTRFRLEQGSGGWQIAAIEPSKELPAGIPYGTHISKVGGDMPQKSEADDE